MTTGVLGLVLLIKDLNKTCPQWREDDLPCSPTLAGSLPPWKSFSKHFNTCWIIRDKGTYPSQTCQLSQQGEVHSYPERVPATWNISFFDKSSPSDPLHLPRLSSVEVCPPGEPGWPRPAPSEPRGPISFIWRSWHHVWMDPSRFHETTTLLTMTPSSE